jgi:hypothetical protein
VEVKFFCRRTRNLHRSTHFQIRFKTKKFGRVQMKWSCRTSFCPNEKWRDRQIPATGLATNLAWDSVLIFCLEVCFLQRKTRITNMTYNCIFLSWNKYTLLQNKSKGLCDTSNFLGILKTNNDKKFVSWEIEIELWDKYCEYTTNKSNSRVVAQVWSWQLLILSWDKNF